MSYSSDLVFKLRVPVSGENVEEYAERSQGRPVGAIETVGLSRAGSPVSFGGEARLLGWLARHNHAHSRPDLMLPPSMGPRDLPSGATTELAYYVLARMSDRVVHNGVDRTDELFSAQRRALQGGSGRLVTPELRAYFYDHQMPGLPVVTEVAPNASTEDYDQRIRRGAAMRRLLTQDISDLGFDSFGSDGPAAALVKPIRNFVAEALENSRAHATSDHQQNAIKGLVFLSIKKYLYREQKLALQATGGVLTDYFDALRRDRGGDLDGLSFAEFTVADSGIGITAHYGRRVNVYADSFEDEVELLGRAFRMSEEAPVGAWNGIGLSKMQEAARDLRGLLTVRTGRVEASKFFLDRPESDLLSIDTRSSARALLGGTAVSLIVPWIDSSPRLPFEV